MKTYVITKLDKGYQIKVTTDGSKECVNVGKSTRRDVLNYLFNELKNTSEFRIMVK
jgi:hypothetical protein